VRWLGTDVMAETEVRRGSGGLPKGGSSRGVDKWHGGLFYRRSSDGNAEPGGECQRKA
jgi:hypothetical protein